MSLEQSVTTVQRMIMYPCSKEIASVEIKSLTRKCHAILNRETFVINVSRTLTRNFVDSMKNYLRKWLGIDSLEERIGKKAESFFYLTFNLMPKKQKTLYEEIQDLNRKIENLEKHLGIEFRQFETKGYFNKKKKN